MKNKIILLAIVAIASATVVYDPLEDLWQAWKIQFNKDYSTHEEDLYRFQVFLENYKYVLKYNSDVTNTAVLGLNIFADLTAEEFKALVVKSYEITSLKEKEYTSFDNIEIPVYWDWRTKGVVGPVENLGQCGSTAIFAGVDAFTSVAAIESGELNQWSTQQVVDCSSCGGCSGCTVDAVVTYIIKNGLESEAAYPTSNSKGKCKYNAKLADLNVTDVVTYVTPKNASALMAAIYSVPTIALIQADQGVFQLYSGGVITTNCGAEVDSALLLVGYGAVNGVGAYFGKNYWGTSWGINGYVYISTNATANSGAGVCGILTEPSYLVPLS